MATITGTGIKFFERYGSMILVVTINSLVERRYAYKKVAFGNQHRNGSCSLYAGGKGINVSRQLNFLNVPNLSFTFMGGSNGKVLREVLTEEKINYSFVKIKNETRDCAVIIDKSQKVVSSFFGENPSVTQGETDEFKSRLVKMIENCEIVVFSGSSPCKEADSIFPFGIETANKFGKLSVCDTYGIHLSECIEKSPTILHNNFQETESSLKISLKSEKEKRDYLDFLYKKGIKQNFLTDAEKPFYAANFDFHYRIEPPKITAVDSTGSGDCFVAGIVYSLHNNLPFEETLLIAASMGALNASRFEVCDVKLSEIESASDEIKNKIKISEIGKKMFERYPIREID
jgi:tagatose 6-phosphate kinase